jgi:tektin-2
MASFVKQTTKYQPSDWFTNGFAISTDAERQRDSSQQIRQESRFLRNETDNKTKWDQYDNTTRLADRIDAIRKWKELLEQTLHDLDIEIKKINDQKDQVEICLENKNIPNDVTSECLVIRESRRSIDNVEDAPEHELKKEYEIIDKAKKSLQQKIDEAFEQICLLQEARQQIIADLQDKNQAMGIDIDQYNLNEQSSNISFKPNPCRVPKGSTTPQQWDDFTRYNIERARAEMGSSQRLREAMHSTVHQTDNDLLAQKNAVDYSIKNRIHETQKALDELKWQKDNTEREIDAMERDINGIEMSIKAKIPTAKLAETRLENRTRRPGVDLCRDAPQYGLVDEVHQISATKSALQEKMKQMRHALDCLEKQLYRINADIAQKERSLELDRACVRTRERLNTKPITQSDSNLMTQGVLRERSKVIA